MATGNALLDTSQYVMISAGQESIILQSHRDTVRIAVSDTQPTNDNSAFHELGGSGGAGRQNMMTVPYSIDPVWALAMTDRSRLTVTTSQTDVSAALEKGMGVGINLDAWGKQKVAEDYSLLHGMFTYDIPVAVWKEEHNDVEELGSFTAATSVNGKLNLTSTATPGEVRTLRSFRNPRYEPNRGHLYSVSMILPDPTNDGVRSFGLFTKESGFMFKLKSDGLYACRRTTIDTVTTDYDELITIPFDIDFSKGNIYDIQFQWRGVGGIKFFVGDATKGASVLVHTMHLLNTLTELSAFNPALPIAFECENVTDQVVIEAGCVDASTEGGKNYDGTYGSITIDDDTGSVEIVGPGSYNNVIIAVHSKSVLNGLVNTRDILNLGLTAYADQRCIVKVWITRDPTAISIGTQSWVDYRDANIEYVIRDNGAVTPVSLDITKAEKQYSSRVNIDVPFPSDAVFDKAASLNVTPGDYLIFTMHRENGQGANVGVTYEFSEEV